MMITEDIKGIIFDCDGVLLDSLMIWEDLGARYLRSKGKVPEEGLDVILFSMSLEQGAEYLKQHYGLEESAEAVGQGLQDMLRDFYFYEVLAKPGAAELMDTLSKKGLRITVATSSPRDHIEKALERNGLLGYVERLFTNSEVGSSKHSPDIYNIAAESMGTKPEETLVFEDSLYALKTAADAGYHTVGVYDSHGESDQEGLRRTADIYVKELAEINI